MTTMTTTIATMPRQAPARRPRRVPAATRTLPAPLRLTRRGRAVRAVVLGMAVTTVFLLVSLLGQSVVSASTDAGQGPALRAIVVEPGQTLWGIATAVAPRDDPRDTVLRLERINDLDGPGIRAGQQLLVPVAG